MLEKILKFFRRESSDIKGFQILLEKEFWPDLYFIMNISAIPFFYRTEGQERIIEIFKRKYQPNGPPLSHLYPIASKRQQQEYLGVHQAICAFLYDEEQNPRTTTFK